MKVSKRESIHANSNEVPDRDSLNIIVFTQKWHFFLLLDVHCYHLLANLVMSRLCYLRCSLTTISALLNFFFFLGVVESIKSSFCMRVLICIICLFKSRIISSIFKICLSSNTYSISVLFIWKRNLQNFLPCLSIFSHIFSKLSHILGHTLD